MTSILFVIVIIYDNQFKCNYLSNKEDFFNFLLNFWNLHQILNILKTKMTLIAYVLSKYRLQNAWLEKAVKSPVSEHPSTVNMLRCHKHCWNLHDSTLTYFSITPREIELENVSLSDIWNLRTVCWQIDCRSVLFVIVTIYGNQFKCNYQKIKCVFWCFSPISEN